MTLRIRTFSMLVILILLMTSGCSAATPTSPLPTTVTPAGVTGYPVLETASASKPDYPAIGDNIVTPIPVGTLPKAPGEAPETDKGTASISGVLFSYNSSVILPNTSFYLTKAQGDDKRQVPMLIVAPRKEYGDIAAQTDAAGAVNLANIPPGNYYLVVWAPMGWSLAENSAKEQKPLLIELKPDQRLAMGVIYLSWP